MSSLKETYDRIAEDWFSDHNNDTWWMKGADHLASMLPADAKVLDIGCGAGHKTKYLLGKGLRVTGADFSEKMIEIARREVPDGRFMVRDLYALGSLGETFDCVFAQAVLLHIPKKDIRTILANVRSVLKEDGLFYLAVKETWPGHPDEETLTENDYGYEYQRFFSYWTSSELQKHLEQAGFEVVYTDIVPVGKTNWIQTIARNTHAH